MSVRRRLALLPRDGLFCKDGRGWHTSASGRGHGLPWPWPSTILGALRTAWGRAEERRTGALFDASAWRERTRDVELKAVIALRRAHRARWEPATRVWPSPADALWIEGHETVERLDPLPPRLPTLGRDDDEAREALWRPRPGTAGKPRRRPPWWSERAFIDWLAGRPVAARAETAFEIPQRVQSHVGIRPEKLTADEGVLFSHDVLETLEREAEWAIGLEVNLPSPGVAPVATLGSDSRLARWEPLPKEIFDPPADLLAAFDKESGRPVGLRMVVVTPACFERGWLPDGFSSTGGEYRGRLQGLDGELVLRAAFVPRPLHVSGWDIAAGAPKPTSRLVPPGAVFFLQRADGAPFSRTDGEALWMAPLGNRTQEGFGRVVSGPWNLARSDS